MHLNDPASIARRALTIARSDASDLTLDTRAGFGSNERALMVGISTAFCELFKEMFEMDEAGEAREPTQEEILAAREADLEARELALQQRINDAREDDDMQYEEAKKAEIAERDEAQRQDSIRRRDEKAEGRAGGEDEVQAIENTDVDLSDARAASSVPEGAEQLTDEESLKAGRAAAAKESKEPKGSAAKDAGK